MKKFINNADTMLEESLAGFAHAHKNLIQVQFDPCFVLRARKTGNNKVALISGGGSGHEPLHTGYVGYGMLDAACPGQIFTSPTPDQIMSAAMETDTGAGVLFIVKNYSGDLMNFEMAAEMIDIPNLTVLVNDDVAVKDSTYTTGRRGVAGTLIVEKILGAAAEQGGSLDQCQALGERVNQCTASMGVAFTSCTIPAAGVPTFEINDNEMEIGVGIHGEPGQRREKIRTADEIVQELMDNILADLNPGDGSQVLLHINGFSGTPLMELYLLYNSAAAVLKKEKIKVARSLVGNYTTSLEMAGASITLTILDKELLAYWDFPVLTPALQKGWKV